MRIIDWGSDVCSTDLGAAARPARPARARLAADGLGAASVARARDAGQPGEKRGRGLCRGGRRHRSGAARARSEEHTSELQSLMRISYAVFCLKKKKENKY